MKAMLYSFRVETLLFVSEKGTLQRVSEDNCRHRPRRVSKQVSLYFIVRITEQEAIPQTI